MNIYPFRPYGRYVSFYPYYLPRYYNNYYPRSFSRYYQPVSFMVQKEGPIKVQNVPEPAAYRAKHTVIVALVVLLFAYALYLVMRNRR